MSALIAEGLFRVEGERAVLLGSRRRSTGAVRFPAERAELFDGTDDIVPIELSTEGTLFTYTTQEFAPPLPYKGDRSPEGFKPYVVGYVELPEGVLVETLIVGAGADDLRIGQSMVSTTTTLDTTDGQSFVTFAFTPA
ncbi:Zn-ribbon domain-containing OB-fold protein [uncultured Mycobacterium sp.]|uniref:Zn-ribbon domain-containing OB-fold protein n=1 Tax=uncultured Mycobacterium sp. TaxID=171292 RepID=UPI0035CAB455